ncbi:sce7726 family protein [Methylocystis sp. JAN1]|uniref:sce7726 family protein n=1 Tax=Methylocystis sp. JAN1 TaxID=3397211 RepID=UPI003FA305AB
MSLKTSQLSALSRLFSSSVFREMAKSGRSPLFARLLNQAGVADACDKDTTVGRAFDVAFAVLRKSGSRNEYVYRAALTHNVLLGTHSLSSASMLTEFRAGASKADVVILNGTATVYEIKSERDTLARLASQISNYRKVFAKIYVIAGEAHVDDVLNETPTDVGVMCLNRKLSIHRIREAAHRPDQVSPLSILESLRSSEACEILKELKVEIPDVPNTLLHRELRNRFEQLDPEPVHLAMVKTLKRSRNLSTLGALVEQLPSSLQPAALSIQVRRVDHGRIIDAVHTPLRLAMAWN